jgi:hypothetical protein
MSTKTQNPDARIHCIGDSLEKVGRKMESISIKETIKSIDIQTTQRSAQLSSCPDSTKSLYAGSELILKETLLIRSGRPVSKEYFDNNQWHKMWLGKRYDKTDFWGQIYDLLIDKGLLVHHDRCSQWFYENGLGYNYYLPGNANIGYSFKFGCSVMLTALGQDFLTSFIQYHLYPNL